MAYEGENSTNPRKKGSNTCETCLKSFSFKRVLKRHVVQVHERKKPFKCTLCKKAFPENSGLKKHEETKNHKKQNCSNSDDSYAQQWSIGKKSSG